MLLVLAGSTMLKLLSSKYFIICLNIISIKCKDSLLSPVLFLKLENNIKQGEMVIDNNRINIVKKFNRVKNDETTFKGDKCKVLHLDAKNASLL